MKRIDADKEYWPEDALENAQTPEQVIEALGKAHEESKDSLVPDKVKGPIKLGSFAEYWAKAQAK